MNLQRKHVYCKYNMTSSINYWDGSDNFSVNCCIGKLLSVAFAALLWDLFD